MAGGKIQVAKKTGRIKGTEPIHRKETHHMH